MTLMTDSPALPVILAEMRNVIANWKGRRDDAQVLVADLERWADQLGALIVHLSSILRIRSITQQEFDAFNPLVAATVDVFVQETEWAADDTGVVLGVIAQDRTDHDWSIAVLGRDERGRFRGIDCAVSFPTRDQARTALYARMAQALATGQTVFPQGD